MALGRLYKIWVLSLVVAFLVSILYIFISVYNIPPATAEKDGFAALPYFIYAHVLVVFCTGLLTALFIKFRKPYSSDKSRLAWAVFITHTGATCLGAALFNYAWIYFINPLAFAVFAALPYISWSAMQSRKNWRILSFIALGILLWAALQAWSWYKIFTFKP